MRIVLIGDGILDNFQHLNNPEHDLTYSLRKQRLEVENYASENTKLFDIHKGIKISKTAQRKRSYGYRTSSDGKMHPLQYLGHNFEMAYSSSSSSVTDNKTVVLSVGGNDINSHKLRLALGIKTFFNTLLTRSFREEYRKVIELIKEKNSRLILITIYLPYLGEGSSYATYQNYSEQLISGWNGFLCEMAKNYNIPVLDLSRTIDPQKREHYCAEDMTHMSDYTSHIVAKCIAHIHNHHDFDADGYRCYYAPDGNVEMIKHDA